MGESLKAFREIDHEITSTLELDAVLLTIARHVKAILKADIAHVYTDPQDLRHATSHSTTNSH